MKLLGRSGLISGSLALALLALGGVGNASNASPSGAATPAAKGPFVVAYANPFIGNDWRGQMLKDLDSTAARLEARGDLKELKVANTKASASEQLNQIRGFISQEVDAIIIDPVSGPAIRGVVAQASAKGILVVLANSPAAIGDVPLVTLDRYGWMRTEALWLSKTLKGKGNIIQVHGVAGSPGDAIAVKAAEDVLKKYPGIKEVARVAGSWDPAAARQAATPLLAAHPDLDGILSHDGMPLGIIKALRAAGRPLVPMTGDYQMSFLRFWKKTPSLKSIAVAYQPGIAADALQVTIQLLRGRTLKPESLKANPLDSDLKNTVYIPAPFVVTKSNLNTILTRFATKDDTYFLDAITPEKKINALFK